MTFTSTRLGQFAYFSQQLGEPDWGGKKVLDFGGNVGNILRDPTCTIEPDRYWCVDVDQESIEQGQQAFPQSHWIFYNRYSFFFNPYGVRRLPLPQLGQTFDYVVAFSVFTNTSEADMLQLVDELTGVLTDKGALAFTFIDPYCISWGRDRNRNNLQWRLDLEAERNNITAAEVEDLDRRIGDSRWFTLVNGGDLYLENEEVRHYEPDEEKTFHVFHTVEYMRALFPQATIRPPVNDKMQHCCIIRK